MIYYVQNLKSAPHESRRQCLRYSIVTVKFYIIDKNLDIYIVNLNGECMNFSNPPSEDENKRTNSFNEAPGATSKTIQETERKKRQIVSTFNDVLAICVISIVTALWILHGMNIIKLPGEILGATITTWILIIQFYFRKKKPPEPT